MNFGEILSKAWKTIWKNKILWLFGVLAGCGAARGNGGNGGSAVSQSMQSNGNNGSFYGFDGPFFFNYSTQRALEDFLQTLADIPPMVWVVLALMLIVVGVFLSMLAIMVGTLGTSGVIKGTILAEEAEADAKPVSLGTVFKAIKPYYWKVFLLNFGLRVLGTIVGFLLVIPIIFLVVCTCFLGLFLLIPVAWFIDLMVNFTTIAIIEENLGIFESIKRAWRMITRHLGDVLVMFLILGVGQLILGLVIALPLVVVPLPLVFELIITGFETLSFGLVLSVLLFIVFMPLVIFLSGVLRAYVLTSWTLTYRQLEAEDELAPIVLADGNGEG
jgi:hypothetical protein